MDPDPGILQPTSNLQQGIEYMDYSPVLSELLIDRPPGLKIMMLKKQKMRPKTHDGLLMDIPSIEPLDYVAKPQRYVH